MSQESLYNLPWTEYSWLDFSAKNSRTYFFWARRQIFFFFGFPRDNPKLKRWDWNSPNFLWNRNRLDPLPHNLRNSWKHHLDPRFDTTTESLSRTILLTEASNRPREPKNPQTSPHHRACDMTLRNYDTPNARRSEPAFLRNRLPSWMRLPKLSEIFIWIFQTCPHTKMILEPISHIISCG